MSEANHILPALPQSWSALTWQQLCDVWTAKMRYGGNPDVAAAAALLALTLGSKFQVSSFKFDETTGESIYHLKPETCQPETGEAIYVVTARELAWMAKQALPWLAFPYGDQGDREERDDEGKVVRERREGHPGYVNPATDWRDAMALPQETVTIDGITFALPQVAMNNLTWHQYRALQAIVPMIFQEGTSDDDKLSMQAQFLAYAMTPEAVSSSAADPFAPRHRFKYDADRAEQTVAFWREQLAQGSPLFHICFQVYQTAMQNYYPSVYPLLFGGSSSKSDPLHTALSGEVDTINAVMKYQGYNDPQQVYDANLPIVFGTLNTMTKEAKEIEKMNQKIKRKH